jgi:hypothetical protein
MHHRLDRFLVLLRLFPAVPASGREPSFGRTRGIGATGRATCHHCRPWPSAGLGGWPRRLARPAGNAPGHATPRQGMSAHRMAPARRPTRGAHPRTLNPSRWANQGSRAGGSAGRVGQHGAMGRGRPLGPQNPKRVLRVMGSAGTCPGTPQVASRLLRMAPRARPSPTLHPLLLYTYSLTYIHIAGHAPGHEMYSWLWLMPE